VLAVALGIVVDNTIHMIVSMQDKATGDVDARENVTRSMRSTGRAVVFTTLALAGAFLSMLGNQLHAVRDMGLVAAVTISGAMLADLLFLPAFYLMTRRRDP
jgi:predicted RND superfamily exporter protein